MFLEVEYERAYFYFRRQRFSRSPAVCWIFLAKNQVQKFIFSQGTALIDFAVGKWKLIKTVSNETDQSALQETSRIQNNLGRKGFVCLNAQSVIETKGWFQF